MVRRTGRAADGGTSIAMLSGQRRAARTKNSWSRRGPSSASAPRENSLDVRGEVRAWGIKQSPSQSSLYVAQVSGFLKIEPLPARVSIGGRSFACDTSKNEQFMIGIGRGKKG